MNFVFTTGGVDDREPLKNGVLLKNIKRKLFEDMGYVGKTLFESLLLTASNCLQKSRIKWKTHLWALPTRFARGNAHLKILSMMSLRQVNLQFGFFAEPITFFASLCCSWWMICCLLLCWYHYLQKTLWIYWKYLYFC